MAPNPEDHRWLLETGAISDCLVICQGHEIRVHKFALCAHSLYFLNLFDGDLEEDKDELIVFPNTNPHVMKHLLDFFYRGTTDWVLPPDDMALHVSLWELAYDLDAVTAMIEIETRLLAHLKAFGRKKLVGNKEFLTGLFSHPPLAQSAVGEIVSEAAYVVSSCPHQHREAGDAVRAAAIECRDLADAIHNWSAYYAEEYERYCVDYNLRRDMLSSRRLSVSINRSPINRSPIFFTSSAQFYVAREARIAEKLTKPRAAQPE